MTLFFSSLLSAWGNALLAFLWQGVLVGIAAALLLRLSHQAKPQVRYAIACVALTLCFALPIASVWSSLSIDATADAGFYETQTIAHVGTDVGVAMSVNTLSDLVNRQMPWIVIVWAFGCAFFSLRMAVGLSWISNARRHASKNSNASLQSKLNLLAIQFGLQRRIQLLVCNEIDSPVTVGWWKPVVFVPAALATRLPPDYIEALLAHELAHIKRFDYLVNLIQSFIEAVLFFHPVVWWLSKQIRIERENIADDLAVEILGEPRQLAVALAALDEFQLAGPLLAPAAQGGNLMSRIQRLIKPNEHVLGWKISAALVCLALACMTAYAYENSPGTKIAGAASNESVAAVEAGDATEATESTEVAEAGDAIEAVEPTEAEAPELGGTVETEDAVEEGEAPEAGEATGDVDDEDNKITINTMEPHQTYALVIEGKEGMLLSGSVADIRNIKKTKQNLSGDFLWFRRDGKTYVVQDPAVLADVKAAWQGSEKLSAQMDMLSAKMEVHSKKMEGISARMDSVNTGSHGRSEMMEKTGREMEVLGKQQEIIGRQMKTISEKLLAAKSDDQRQTIERDMRVQHEKMAVLDGQMQKLATLMEQFSTKLDNDLKPLEALSREMEVASKPMEVLGREMQVLGKQQEALSKKADQKVLGIINSSLKNGQARPL